jgi:transposase-like protein
MSKAQLVITAVVLEGRSKSEVARDYEVSRNWVQQLARSAGADMKLLQVTMGHASSWPPRTLMPTSTTRTSTAWQMRSMDSEVEGDGG